MEKHFGKIIRPTVLKMREEGDCLRKIADELGYAYKQIKGLVEQPQYKGTARCAIKEQKRVGFKQMFESDSLCVFVAFAAFAAFYIRREVWG